MTARQLRAQYMQQFRLEAVRQVRAGQAIGVVARVLGIPKASLGNWMRPATKGPLSGAGDADKATRVSHEQMEIARLPGFVWSVTSQKKPRRTSRRTRCEGSLDSPNEAQVPGERLVWHVGGQRQRLLQLAAPTTGPGWKTWRAPQRRGCAGPYPGHPRLGQGRIRLAPDAQGVAGQGHSGGQRQRAQVDEAARHPGQDQAQVLGHHRQQAQLAPMAPDLVQRRFNPEIPNQLWCGDFTYIATDDGWP